MPDIDTVCYTLAGLNDKQRGWGRKEESWTTLQTLKEIGGETWFQLGDKDLALHLERQRLLNQGLPLSLVTSRLADKLGVKHPIVPMSDQSIRTIVDTHSGRYSFQEYFVRYKCEPKVTHIGFNGIEHAKPTFSIIEALQKNQRLQAIILCPSNPFLSSDPILAVPGIRNLIKNACAPVIAVSPIISGSAVKGPTAKIFQELGMTASALNYAKYYMDILDGFVMDIKDSSEEKHAREVIEHTHVSQTLMATDEDKRQLAEDVIKFARQIMNYNTMHGVHCV